MLSPLQAGEILMSWTRAQLGELFALAESGALTPSELDAAAAEAPLAPPRGEWLAAADRLCAFGGALLVMAGLIFFFAWNWAELHRFAKLAAAFAALAGCVGVALPSTPFGTVWRAALFGACLALGALLALIGQIYQSGADVWELFAAWAALMLPFALLARSAGAWALWLVVANAALLRALSESVLFRFLGALDGPTPVLVVAGFNLIVLVGFEAFGGLLLAGGRRDLQRLAGLGVIGPLALGAAIAWWEPRFLPLAPAYAVVAALAAWGYLVARRDVAMLALTVFSAIAVAGSGLARVLPERASFLTLNLLALFVIVTSALAAMWLTRLTRETRRT
jgi:uncharacterized membrane protein